MSLHATPDTILNKVAGSLVASRVYASAEEALWEIALSAVRNKAGYYQRRIRSLERKYGVDYDSFTARLKGRASPAEEDDWLDWRSALSMLKDWQSAYQELLKDRPGR